MVRTIATVDHKDRGEDLMDMPATTTLPDWFWVLFYAVLIITLIISIFSIIRRMHKGLSIINLIAVVTAPFVHFLGSIGRPGGLNEFEHFFSYLIQGSLWAIYVSIGYIFILFWWVLFSKTVINIKFLTKV